MIDVSELNILQFRRGMEQWEEGKRLICVLDADALARTRRDVAFSSALSEADILVPGDCFTVLAIKAMHAKAAPREPVTGTDLFRFEMDRLEQRGGGLCFFLGGTPGKLEVIRKKTSERYPHIRVDGFCPEFRPYFSKSEDEAILDAVKAADPDLLWVWMGRPKQEKWMYYNWNKLDIHCHACIAESTLDYYAGSSLLAAFKRIRDFFSGFGSFMGVL